MPSSRRKQSKSIQRRRHHICRHCKQREKCREDNSHICENRWCYGPDDDFYSISDSEQYNSDCERYDSDDYDKDECRCNTATGYRCPVCQDWMGE